jgi:hypothetical protein
MIKIRKLNLRLLSRLQSPSLSHSLSLSHTHTLPISSLTLNLSLSLPLPLSLFLVLRRVVWVQSLPPKTSKRVCLPLRLSHEQFEMKQASVFAAAPAGPLQYDIVLHK